MFELEGEFTPAPRVLVVGAGSSTRNVLVSMMAKGIEGLDLLAIDSFEDDRVWDWGRYGGGSDFMTRCRRMSFGIGIPRPGSGKRAVETAGAEIAQAVDSYDLVIVLACLGGRTGTDGAPIVAGISRELGILTLAIATTPLESEGPERSRLAREGIERLKGNTDAIFLIPNQTLPASSRRGPSINPRQPFEAADDVLHLAVRALTDPVLVVQRHCTDFADFRDVMRGRVGFMGFAEASGDRAEEAAREALTSPLLGGRSFAEARHAIVTVTAGSSVSVEKRQIAFDTVVAAGAAGSDLHHYCVLDESLADALRMTVIATGFGPEEDQAQPGSPSRTWRSSSLRRD